jgi:hypothetical protein
MITTRYLVTTWFVIFLTTVVSATSLLAGQESKKTMQSPAIFETIWQTPKLYNNKENHYIQKFNLVGRYHGQYWWANSEGNSDRDWENRRMYVGFNAKIFSNITVEVQVNLNDDFDPVYKGLYDAFIKWQPSESNVSISAGRLDYVYTGMERSTSSKRIKTMERALLVGQVMPGEVIGVYINDTIGNFSYQTGLFSGSIKDEFTDFKGGYGALLGIQYDLALFYDTGSLHLDYLYNNGNKSNDAFKPYENIISLWHEGQRGAFGFGVDLTAATGVTDQSDVFGLTVLPTLDLAHNLLISNDKLQLAMRYHYAASSDEYGLQFNKRYEQPVTSGTGDSYNSFYLGFNYYLYQQKLKFMAGIEYFTMDGVADTEDENFNITGKDVDGWNGSTGIRLYF